MARFRRARCRPSCYAGKACRCGVGGWIWIEPAPDALNAWACQLAGVVPSMPAARLDPRADPPPDPVAERFSRVAQRETIDVGEIGIVSDLDHQAVQADVAVPVVVEHRETHLRVA